MTTTAGTLSAVTDNGNGTYTAVLTSASVMADAIIGVIVNGATAGVTATVSFVAGEPSLSMSTITATPDTIIANGANTSTIVMALVDAQGHPVAKGSDVVSATTTAGQLSAVTDNSDGTFTATLTASSVVATATVSFTVNNALAEATTTVMFVPGPVAVDASMVVATPVHAIADGVSTATVTVTLKDEFGNQLVAGGDHVAMNTTGGTLSDVTDNGDGTYTASLTSPDTIGTATIGFTVNAVPASATVDVVFVAGPAAAGSSSIDVTHPEIPADGISTSAITVSLRDIKGNPLRTGGDTVAMTTTAGTLAAVTDNDDGTYTAILTSSLDEGAATLSYAVNGSFATATATVVFAPVAVETQPSADRLPATGLDVGRALALVVLLTVSGIALLFVRHRRMRRETY